MRRRLESLEPNLPHPSARLQQNKGLRPILTHRYVCIPFCASRSLTSKIVHVHFRCLNSYKSTMGLDRMYC